MHYRTQTYTYGIRHSPREWFIAPLEIIVKAAEMMMSGDIANHKYDKELQRIVIR